MPTRLSERYEYLFDELLQRVGNGVKATEGAMTALWPMCGHRYDGRLMIVGRATNGWEGRFTAEDLQRPAGRKMALGYARDTAENGVPEWRKPGRCPMLWVTDQWNDPRGGGYTTSKSRLWLLTRELSMSLGLPASASQAWPSSICWSDLYKVAPKDKRNLSESLKRVQLASASRLLAKEMDELSPKLVVVLAGRDWYDPFLDALALKVERIDGPAVEAIARDGDRRWILAKPATYMSSGVTVDTFQRDVVSTALRLTKSA